MKTEDIFKGQEIHYRNSDIDTTFLQEWADEKVGDIKSFPMGDTIKNICKKHTGTDDEKELVKYTFTLPQIELMIKEPEKYELLTDGWGNLFLVLNKEGDVSVVYVYRYDAGWYVGVCRLGYDYQWYVGLRFFFRNLTLKTSVHNRQSMGICSEISERRRL